MIAKRCVLDSNVLIYHLNGVLNDGMEKLLADVLLNGPYISVITRIEILGWRRHTAASLQYATELLSYVNEQGLTTEIIQKCIQLRQNLSIKIPDALIGATAIHLALPLMTVTSFEIRGTLSHDQAWVPDGAHGRS
ncbi:MAG: hypothetical protein BECKG1743D_GA0114223_110844 [Candidatus Kentron sp. G]|nr:MAG: hypothetical protein BECKG1743F_GA0114225_111064 [Candidatus Kentron sp. G]VFN06803.1 MAG: hypothetical protein BECKG1743E_GA0114224_110714 [Candidatus Kentron sp. G]VFN07520.1 MAG: hypothetical protein BECKG1743D_GA0114223_110844 [Candidatus Kentron sp. G]